MNRTFIPKLFTVYKKGYSRDQVSKDIISGVIVGIVALPLAIAFAIATGLHNLKEIIHSMQSTSTKIILSGVQPSVFKVLEKARVVFMVGKKNITRDIGEAIELVKGEGNL